MSHRLNTTANKRQNLDSTFKVNPFQSLGFRVQPKSDESVPATKAQLWESYQQAKQLNQSGAIQTKLTIGQPGDKYEQEADIVADRVMAMPEPKLAKTSVTNSVQQTRSSIEPIQRVCTDCQEEPKEESKSERDDGRIQAQAELGQTPELTSVRRKLDSADDPQSGSNSDSQLNGSQGKSILAITDRLPARIQREPDKMPPPTGTTTIDKKNETISASGNTLTEAITNLSSQGKGEAGRVTCAPDWDKQAWQPDENKPAATIVTANVTVTETKAMPVWTELDRQCEPVKKEWARFYQALDRHEEGHITIDETSFKDLHKKLLGKTPTVADGIFSTTVTQANTKNDAYDATTQHGLTQGTAVTPVQCQAMEKVSDNQQRDGEGAEVQAKFSDSLIQRATDNTLSVEPDLESRIGSSKGGGSPLSNDVRSFMEPRFGADFSGVRVHTGSDAVQMTQGVNAQAFAHGSDIYFGAGKAPGKDTLTAHELTHVVQQTGGVNQSIQRQIGPQHDLSQGTFDLNATPQDATSGGPNVPITIKFTPKATAPYSNQIGLIQIVRVTDTSGGNIEPASLPAARGASLRTQAGDGTGVDAGYFTDTLHNPSPTHPNVPAGNANQGDALAPQYPVGNGASQPNSTTPGLSQPFSSGAGGAVLGYKRSDDANDIKAAEITDAPGSSGDVNFAFETVAKGEDTNTVYGAVKWSFNIHSGKIENDTSSAVDNQSATFDAALERHRDFYVHEPQVFYFEFDSDVLSSNEIAKIGTFKTYLARFAAAPNLVQVTPTGFADQRGNVAHNLALSLRRATAVRAALLAQGIPEAQIQPITIGGGATTDFTQDATTDQDSDANRRGNRRVVLTFEYIAAAAPSGTGGTGGTP